MANEKPTDWRHAPYIALSFLFSSGPEMAISSSLSRLLCLRMNGKCAIGTDRTVQNADGVEQRLARENGRTVAVTVIFSP